MRIPIISIFNKFTVIALLVALIGSAVQVKPVYAANSIVVNSNEDTDTDTVNDGKCTLREAITAANLNSARGGCTAGTAGADAITFATDYTITVGSQLPYVNSQITITGHGATNTIIQADADLTDTTKADWRVFRVTNSANANLTLDGVTVRHGVCKGLCTTAGIAGGSGEAVNGGGIYNAGTLTVKNSTILGNIADKGGGIYNAGTLTVMNSTFSGNTADKGGGIYNAGTLIVENSTFSGNTAHQGGSIHNTGPLTMRSSTIAGNTADDLGGGGIFKNSGIVRLKNTLIANNQGGNCKGKITNDGNNLDSGATCDWGSASGSLSNMDPLLGPLAYNGGPTQTQTMALQTGSPAIDAGGDCPATDQRGVTRPKGAGCDIGAFEYENPSIAIVVNTNADGDPVDDGLCTLREAINAANSDTASGAQAGECAAGAGADTIAFTDNYTITLAGSQLPLVTSPIMITGKGADNTIIQAAEAPNTAAWRVFQVDALGNLTLDRLTVRYGVCNGSCSIVGEILESQSDGGGVYNAGTLTVTNSTFSENTALGLGGAIYNDYPSVINAMNSVFSGNNATYGGGIYNIYSTMTATSGTFSGNNATTTGGGIYNAFSTVIVTSSTFSGNSALDGSGGGIYNVASTVTVTNSTISANSAFDGGGGIYFANECLWIFDYCVFSAPAIMNITNSTIAGNTASQGGGIFMNQGDLDVATLTNTIVANNSLEDCGGNIDPSNGGSNLASDSTCGWGSNSGSMENVTDPMLGPLADNSGRTQTMALLEGSPAIDNGNDAVCDESPVNGVDQRGLPRPIRDHCDIGAYEAPAPRNGADTAGIFRPVNGMIFLKNTNDTGFADVELNYGAGGDYPVAGDWDGDGTDTIGVYRGNRFLLRNSNTVGFADLDFVFGEVGDQPVAGDWDGDGTDTIGVYRPSTGQFLLRNSNSPGPADMSFYLGNIGDVAIAGDWNGDGVDTTGVFRPSNGVIFLKNINATGFADVTLNFGVPGDRPVTGDWNADGIDTIGVYRNGSFYLRNDNSPGYADLVFALGNPGDMPIAGNWDGVP